ncbi:MAG: hypothetical protein AB1505_35700, partial [Candidatus Latescibacterota bacterium]
MSARRSGRLLLRLLAAAAALAGIACSGAAPTGAPGPEASDWIDRARAGAVLRAVHLGGNWGTNVESAQSLPAAGFDYLTSLGADWVGISVALHTDDALDSTVERVYAGVGIPTFPDPVLRGLIAALRARGFSVYLTLAFENWEAMESAHPVTRSYFGDPAPADAVLHPQPGAWPWDPAHPEHEGFVAEFFRTYSEQAVHFGRLAQDTGVALYSLGTETDRLFRTRPGGRWPNDYADELRGLVAAVRQVYAGPLTYDMSCLTLLESGFYGPGSDHLWEDLGLEVVGISAYFPLARQAPNLPPSAEECQAAWDWIFDAYLVPLAARNPGRPLLFTEVGYTNAVRSPLVPNAEEFVPWAFTDRDGSGLDDGD